MIKRIAATAALFLAAPALATGGFECRATDGSGLALAGTVGHGIVTPLVGARLTADGVVRATHGEQPEVAVAQSWIDGERLWLDLVDPQALRFEARLRAIVKGYEAKGTIVRDGKTHPVRCHVD